MSQDKKQNVQQFPPFNHKNEETPDIGGGLPVVEYWAKHTISPEGLKLWKTLLHHSACLSCSWATGGQEGAVHPGAALFYPEVNVIFNVRVEKRAGTPAFKRVPVFVYAN